MSNDELADTVLDILNFDIDELEQRRDWHLRAPWDGRLCNQGAWHDALLKMNNRLTSLRLQRAELLVDRGIER